MMWAEIVAVIQYIIIIALPWVLGAGIAIGVAVSLRRQPYSPGFAPIVVAIGGYLGQICVARSLAIFEYNIFALDPTVFLAGALLISIASVALLFACLLQTYKSPPTKAFAFSRIVLCAFISCYGCFSLAVMVFQTIHVPSVAWDNFHVFHSSAIDLITLSTAGNGAEFIYENRHPVTLILISVWSAQSAFLISGEGGLGVGWFLTWLSIGLLLFGYCRRRNVQTHYAILAAIVGVTLPLLENHAVLAGYSELFVTLALLGSVVLISLGLKLNLWMLIALGILLSATQVTLKNIGVMYASLPILSLCSITVMRQTRKYRLAWLLVILIVMLILWELSVSVVVLPHEDWPKFGFDSGQMALYFAGKRLQLFVPSFTEIVENYYFAYFKNASFHIMGTSILLMSGLFFSKKEGEVPTKFIFITVIFGLLALTGSQFSEYGFEHAVAGSDTGNSRFSLPILTLVSLLFVSRFCDLCKEGREQR